MNPLESILHRAQKLISGGLERSPQDYLYLDIWYHVGEKHLYHVLGAAGTSVMLLCQPESFSPFARFFHQDPPASSASTAPNRIRRRRARSPSCQP